MRQTAVLALRSGSPFQVDALEVVLDLGYEVVQAADELDAESLCKTLAPALVVTEPSAAYTVETIRTMSVGAQLVVVLEPGQTASARTVESWIHLAAPPREPGILARNLYLLALARRLQIPIHVEKQQLAGRIERKPLLLLAQELLDAGFTGRVELDPGSFFVSDGQIIDARCRPVTGEKAFFRLVRTVTGAFTVQPGPVVVDRRIRTSTEELIAEAVGEILVQYPPPDLRVLVNPSRMDADLPAIQLQILEVATKSPILESILDGVPAPDGVLLQEIVHLQQSGQIVVDNPATSVRIVTDTAIDVPAAASESPLLEVIPLKLATADGEEITGLEGPTDFYRHLRDGHTAPELAPLPADTLLRVYRNLLPKQDLVSIHASEHLSKTKAVAFQAAQQLLQSAAIATYKRSAPRLKVVDTQSAGLGAGLLVLFATRMAARGKTADFIAQRLSRMSHRTISLFGIGDASFFLRESRGRFGSAWRRSGATPILSMAGGELEAVATVDTPHDIERRMVEVLCTSLEPRTSVVLGVAHAAARQSARRLRELLEREFDVLEVVEGEIGPLLGRRTGPGAVAASVFVPESEEIGWIQPIGDLQSDYL